MMTVKELVAVLQTMPPNCKVSCVVDSHLTYHHSINVQFYVNKVVGPVQPSKDYILLLSE